MRHHLLGRQPVRTIPAAELASLPAAKAEHSPVSGDCDRVVVTRGHDAYANAAREAHKLGTYATLHRERWPGVRIIRSRADIWLLWQAGRRSGGRFGAQPPIGSAATRVQLAMLIDERGV